MLWEESVNVPPHFLAVATSDCFASSVGSGIVVSAYECMFWTCDFEKQERIDTSC